MLTADQRAEVRARIEAGDRVGADRLARFYYGRATVDDMVIEIFGSPEAYEDMRDRQVIDEMRALLADAQERRAAAEPPLKTQVIFHTVRY